MTRALLPLVALASLVSASACGNYSLDELRFQASLPRLEDLALVPPGVTLEPMAAARSASSTQAALEACGPRDLRCTGQRTAEWLNAVSLGVLRQIDALSAFPPGRRTAHRRIWGPFRGEDGVVVRLEILRGSSGDFWACVHLGEGEAPELGLDDISCDDEHDVVGNLSRVALVHMEDLGGEVATRGGDGELWVWAGRLAALDPSFRLQGVLSFRYVHDDVGRTVLVTIDDQPADSVFLGARYRFVERLDGGGDFAFSVRGQFSQGIFGGQQGNELERLDIATTWSVDGAGRADAAVSGGDLTPFFYGTTQCWDDGLVTVYYRDGDPAHPTEGRADDCAVAEPLVDPLVEDDFTRIVEGNGP